MKNTILTNPQNGNALSLTTGVLSAIGSATGTPLTGRNVNKLKNDIVAYFGRLIKVQEGEYYEWDGANWNSVHAPAFFGDNGYCGLYPVLVGGNPRLLSAIANGSNQFVPILYDPIANTWSSGTARVFPNGGVLGVWGGIVNSQAIGNNLYIYYNGSGNGFCSILEYNPNSDTLANIDIISTNVRRLMSPIAQWQNTPIVLRPNTGLTAWELISITGGSPTIEDTFGTITGITAGALQDSQCALFIDPNNDDLICIYLDNFSGANSQWQARRFSGALGSVTGADISGAILPAALTSSQARDQEQWRAFTDEQDVPGTMVVKLILQSQGSNGGTAQRYNYVNNGANLTTESNIASSGLAWAENTIESGGDRIWTAAKIHCGIEGTPVGSVGFDTVTIRLVDPAGASSNHQVQFYWTDPNGEYPDTLAGLQNPSAGSISGGNLWTGLNATSAPGTQHTVEVLLPGTSPGDRLRLTAIAV